MKKYILILSLLILLPVFLLSCKPYNSNEVNRQLLQGSWKLIATNNLERDSSDAGLHIDFDIRFEGDSCCEYARDFNRLTKYKFLIDDFSLDLFNNDSLVSKINITTLTKDSLTLSQLRTWWVYKKIE